jgi:hypothetical protein
MTEYYVADVPHVLFVLAKVVMILPVVLCLPVYLLLSSPVALDLQSHMSRLKVSVHCCGNLMQAGGGEGARVSPPQGPWQA